ncbi:MAG: acetyl-CoA carboxylase biotin carboxylase subunit [Myxococcota bacterium]
MELRPFRRVLVANRGEIAVRVIRGCHDAGLEAVAVYSEADADGLAVRLADEAVPIGPAASQQSYLRPEKILAAAAGTGCDAIHPGYGFLSENAEFARQVMDAGLVWIGPPPEAIASMGNKTAARRVMRDAGVPLVPGTVDPVETAEEAERVAADIGLPVMVKAAAGGGGKGMRAVFDAGEVARAWRTASSEATQSFNNGDVYLERLVQSPRHVEVQVLSDGHGKTVHLFERDCSIQRRHQKVFEESPCPVLPEATRQAMCQAAVAAADAVSYVGAGTVEFLYEPARDEFYFLEMNTRLQVEHPITEQVTGIDLVAMQLRVAMGEPLPFDQSDLVQRGHAVECRVYAEDATANFRPAPGPLHGYREPTGPWVRVDSGVTEGMDVVVHYDPMISKLIVWGPDRATALARCARALHDYHIVGVPTSIPFFLRLFEDEAFQQGQYDTGFITPEWLAEQLGSPEIDDDVIMAAAIARFEADRSQPADATMAVPTSGWRRARDWRTRRW